MGKPKILTTIDFLRSNISSSTTPLNLEVCADMIKYYLLERYYEHGNETLNNQTEDLARDLNKEIADRLDDIVALNEAKEKQDYFISKSA